MSTRSTVRLTPPDHNQCQARVPTGGPFTVGGEIGNPQDGYRIRCRNTPLYIVTEDKDGEDGQRGSMSLCRSCRDVFVKQTGEDGYTFRPVQREISTK